MTESGSASGSTTVSSSMNEILGPVSGKRPHECLDVEPEKKVEKVCMTLQLAKGALYHKHASSREDRSKAFESFAAYGGDLHRFTIHSMFPIKSSDVGEKKGSKKLKISPRQIPTLQDVWPDLFKFNFRKSYKGFWSYQYSKHAENMSSYDTSSYFGLALDLYDVANVNVHIAEIRNEIARSLEESKNGVDGFDIYIDSSNVEWFGIRTDLLLEKLEKKMGLKPGLSLRYREDGLSFYLRELHIIFDVATSSPEDGSPFEYGWDYRSTSEITFGLDKMVYL